MEELCYRETGYMIDKAYKVPLFPKRKTKVKVGDKVKWVSQENVFHVHIRIRSTFYKYTNIFEITILVKGSSTCKKEIQGDKTG